MDAPTTSRVVESLVLRGDISALTQEERARYYVQLCDSLGLSPAALPFIPLKLNGKEILYASRTATDQLAAIHRLTREIVDGPRVIDLAGTKLVYAVCRATHPNGRSETSVATVPLTDPANVLMKAETKAKRRATLSILGLALLDEAEIETIPAHAKAPGLPVTPSLGIASPPEIPQALARFYAHLEQIELPGECVAAWNRYRGDLAKLPRTDRDTVWKALVKRCEEVGKMKNATMWLKRAIAEEDARMVAPESDDFFDNATPTSAQSPVADHIDAPKVTDTPALDALRADLAEIAPLVDTTLLNATRVWRKHSQAVYMEAAGDAEHLYEAQKIVLGITRVGCTRNQLNEHVAALEMRDKTPRDSVYADVMDLLELTETADEIVEVWKTHKAAIDLRPEEARTLLRKIATRRVQELQTGMADAKQAAQWLKNALAPQGPKPPNGSGPKPEAPVITESDPERDAIVNVDQSRENNQFAQVKPVASEQERFVAYLASIDHAEHVCNGVASHEGEYSLPDDTVTRLAVERMVALGKNAMNAVNALAVARKRKRSKAA
jgi:hypothetical protein